MRYTGKLTSRQPSPRRLGTLVGMRMDPTLTSRMLGTIRGLLFCRDCFICFCSTEGKCLVDLASLSMLKLFTGPSNYHIDSHSGYRMLLWSGDYGLMVHRRTVDL